VVNADGTVDYSHDGSETTSDSFTYRILDNSGATSNTTIVSITVTPVNDEPVLSAIGDQIVDEETVLSFTANATDADLPANSLTFSLDAVAMGNGMTISSTGDFSWVCM